jgi:hypothetical protein
MIQLREQQPPHHDRRAWHDRRHLPAAWAKEQGAAYLALATRRADDFYRTIGYSESATFFRKVLDWPTQECPSGAP